MSLKLGLTEPGNLEEWAAYTGRINRILGYSDKKAERLKKDVHDLYHTERKANMMRQKVRRVLEKRLERASFIGPFEESLSIARAARSRIKKLFKPAPGPSSDRPQN